MERNFTALERAEAILRDVQPWCRSNWLRDAIHRVCVEHSNAELERRRKVEARVQNASTTLRSLIEWLWESGSPRAARMAEEVLKALEGGDA